MAIAFGRGKREDAEPEKPTLPPTALNAHLVKELQSAAEKDFTGSVEVVDKASGAAARVYLYNGGLYAVTLDGYQPPLAARLQASGVLDESRVDYLAGVDRPGPEAVRLNWLSADQLATVHQEYVLASLGAVLACAKAKIHVHKGDVTDAFCTLPLPLAPLLESVQVRGQRLTSTWPGLTTDALPSTATVWVTGVPLPPTLKLPELASLRGVADGRRTVDEVAEAIGFTRAEAVHLIGMLVTAGVLRVDPLADAVVPTDRYLVPEAFATPGVTPARQSVAPAATPAVPATPAIPVVEQVVVEVVEPEPEQVVAEIVEPEPVVEVAEIVEPVVEIVEPEPAATPETEPEPEPAATPETEPEPAPQPVRPDDHVVALRRELAAAEVAELTEALADAVRAEREAIAAAASVRARLLQAKQELVELGGTPTDEGA